MKIAIVGCRNYPHPEWVREFVESLPDDAVVVSGHGGIVDLTAEQAAKTRGLETVIFPADWDAHGKAAGPMRNKKIAAECDEMRAYWDGNSRGTKSAIDAVLWLDKPLTIVWTDGTEKLPGDFYR